MTVIGAWDLLVDRDELSRTRIVDEAVPDAAPGEAVLKVDRVGMTANNVTYAIAGRLLSYWEFFPAPEGWGRVPLWGFADVVSSRVDELTEGTRVYGYLPPSSHLLVRPERVSGDGFRDASEHRAQLPVVYNEYIATSGDPAYEADREDLQILFRPLFITSFVLDDFLADNDFFGADAIVVSSASSKTAYGAAFCIGLRPSRPQLVGLTSPGNVAFTTDLGCYDEIISYDEVTTLPTDRPTLYVDTAGSSSLRETLHHHLGDRLVYDSMVGVTHQDAAGFGGGELPGVQPVFFFAPDQMKKRRTDWGPGGIKERHASTWKQFAPVVENWVDVKVGTGPEGLRDAWLEVLSGRSAPRVGNVIAL